jgi:hypothetical protein
MDMYPAPKLIQYEESNHPFYKKGIKLVDAAYDSELGVSYCDQAMVIRGNDTHGRCSGKWKKYCCHCQTIEAAMKAVEEGPEFV